MTRQSTPAVTEAALVAGVRLDQVARAAGRAPRPVLLGAGLAALAGIAAIFHFTGFFPAGGTTAIAPYVTSARTSDPR